MMKKLALMLACGVVLFSAFGCAPGEGAENGEGAGEEAARGVDAEAGREAADLE